MGTQALKYEQLMIKSQVLVDATHNYLTTPDDKHAYQLQQAAFQVEAELELLRGKEGL